MLTSSESDMVCIEASATLRWYILKVRSKECLANTHADFVDSVDWFESSGT